MLAVYVAMDAPAFNFRTVDMFSKYCVELGNRLDRKLTIKNLLSKVNNSFGLEHGREG